MSFILTLRIPDMDCPVEVNAIEKALTGLEGLTAMRFDTASRTAFFTVDDEALSRTIMEKLTALSFPGELVASRPICENAPQLRLLVPDMDCPTEVGQIREALKSHPGITDMHFDTTARTVLFTLADASVDARQILATLKAIGLPATVEKKAAAQQSTIRIENMVSESDAQAVLKIIGLDAALDKTRRTVTVTIGAEHLFSLLERLEKAGWKAGLTGDVHELKSDAPKIPVARLALGFVFAAAAEAVELTGVLPDIAILAFSAAAILLAGIRTIVRGLTSLLHFVFNMSTLMAVAVVGACLLGSWPEAAMVMVLYEIGEAIEGLSMVRAKKAISALLDVAPSTVSVRVGQGWQKLPVSSVPVGAVYRIEPGERAALDGVVVEGSGSMDESMITGESLPVTKSAGSDVWAGALTLESALLIRATAKSTDSMSARIIRAVQEAEQKKAPVQRFIDKFAARYTPTVFVLALLTAVLGCAVTGDFSTWIYRALVLLVIACPCALVISTPVTIVSAIALAAQRGVLIKGGVFLEEGRLLKHVALDKTGTITKGEPSFVSETLMGGNNSAAARTFAASLAAMSSHPVSRALTREFEQSGVKTQLVKDFKALAGYGTEGRISGSLVRLTNQKWLAAHNLLTPEVEKAFAAAHEKGQTAVAVSDLFGVLAVFAVADTVKPESARAVRQMKAAGLTPHLLTGDNARAAGCIAASVGIDSVKSELLPEMKLAAIEELEASGPTAMAGDGINDAPALTRAHIGFAMGTKGADTAIEAADVALMDDNIGKIAWFKRLSQLTHRTLITNIVFSLGVKALFALAALMGLANMWMAVFADTGVSLIVVAYGMRLMKAGKTVDKMTAAE